MKVRISDISPAGLLINETISLDSLNERMALGRSKEIVFTEAPHVSLVIRKTASGAETVGTVSSKYRQPCSLCLKEADREITAEANYILKPRPPVEERGPNDSFEDDVGIVYYDDDHVELEETLQEALILLLSIYWHPPLDKDGKCTKCGCSTRDLGIESAPSKTTLGDLFKKAGVKSDN